MRLLAASAGKPVYNSSSALPVRPKYPPLSGGSAARPRIVRPSLQGEGGRAGEGRIRTSEAARATDLQSGAFDRFATSPIVILAAIAKKRASSARHTESAVASTATLHINCLDLTVATSPAELAQNPLSCSFPPSRYGGQVELAKGFEPPTG